jgi:ABC-type antimicrobial peptide transport system permease subunit
VRGLVLRDTVIILFLGLLTGLPAAFAAGQVTQSLLFGVTPTSPRVFALTGAVLGVAALIATVLPARRASQADPMLALRN